LKIETEFLDNHQVKIQVEIETAPFDDAKQRAARKISKKTKIPGFRPGKAPYAVIVRHFGEPVIVEEAMELLVDELYPKILKEADITPYGPGTLENLSLEPPKLDFLIPLSPTVELGDYRSIRIPYDYKDVSENNVDETIADIRERQVILEPVERPAQEGDQVYIRLSGLRLNPKEDQDTILIKERDASIIIKPETVDETEFPFSGFSRNLIGLSIGDEKTINYTYPENDRYTDLIGVQAEFYIKVNEIKSRTLPELNDEFAQTLGDFETYEDLRNAVKTNLEEQAKEAFHQTYDDKALTEIVSISTIKYPPQMVEREIDRTIDNLKSRLSQQRMDIDLYLKSRKLDMAGLREEVRPVAETGLKKSLVLMEITDAEKIDVDRDELTAETSRTLDAMSQYLPEHEARKIMNNQDSLSNLFSNIMFDMMSKKTLEKIRGIASGKEEQTAVVDVTNTENPVSDTSVEATETIETDVSPDAAVSPVKPKRKSSKKKVEET